MTTFLLHGVAAGLAVTLAARAPIDPCALLTKAEAEAILGKPIAAPEGSGSQCTYTAQAGSGDIMLHVFPLTFASKEEFHAFLVKDTEEMNARLLGILAADRKQAVAVAAKAVPRF